MKALLGQKIGMSRVFSPEGEVIPVTLIHAWPNSITLHRTEDKDGYVAVQLALPKRKEENGKETQPSHKATVGGEKENKGMKPREERRAFFVKREFRGELPSEIVALNVSQFKVGDIVQVTGISKGKGFSGVVKRHHFKGGPKSHGHRHVLRRPGSIGSRFPQHTRKGMRMAGRMGSDTVTVKNLTVVAVDSKNNIIAVKGAVPGTRGSIVAMRSIEPIRDTVPKADNHPVSTKKQSV